MILPGLLDPLDDWDAADAAPGVVPGQLGKHTSKESPPIQRIIKGTR